ncbi:hypothetical protein Hte_008993 [Hypoxylon texense]
MAHARLPASSVTYNGPLSDDQSNSDAHHETTTAVVPRDQFSSTEDNECGDAKFTNYVNSTYPGISDCKAMMNDADPKGFWEWGGDELNQYNTSQCFSRTYTADDNGDWTCGFCVAFTEDGPNMNKSLGIKIGTQDIIDLTRDSIAQTGGSAKIRMGGSMSCNSRDLNEAGQPASQLVNWWLMAASEIDDDDKYNHVAAKERRYRRDHHSGSAHGRFAMGSDGGYLQALLVFKGGQAGSARTPPRSAASATGTVLCPGRHFVSTEVLSLATLLLLRFGLKSAAEGGRWADSRWNPGMIAPETSTPRDEMQAETVARDRSEWRVHFSPM